MKVSDGDNEDEEHDNEDGVHDLHDLRASMISISLWVSDCFGWVWDSDCPPVGNQRLRPKPNSSVDWAQLDEEVWLHQLFRGYGEVVDVFIPNKRSSRFNTKFGFVRFKSRDEAERAVQNLNGILIRDYYIHVNLARFSQDSRSRIPLQKACDRVHEATNFPVNIIKSKEFGGDCSPSFADIVASKSLPGTTGTRFSIKVQDEGNQWLSTSVVAKLPSIWSVESLSEAFIADGVGDIQIHSMGGNFVLLTFPSIEDMNAMLEESDLDFNGKVFPVRVVEEHVGVTNFINASCRCNKGCDAKTVGLSKSKEKPEGEMGAIVEDMVENSSNNGAEDVNGENKEAIVETDPGNDESFDFDVDKVDLENEMEIIEEVAETNVEAEKDIGAEEFQEQALVDNQESWVKNLVKENPVIAENLRGENDKDENIPEHHFEAFRTENEPFSASIKAAINGVKGKKKRKTIDDILGITRVNSVNNKSRNNKPKCAVYRSAVAALALSASISSDGVINRNRIILDEAQAIWTCNKIMGLGYDGEEDEVISKFADMVAEDLDSADKVAGQA
ncbi:hypothetical protein RHGRI_027065 [Rhododendron griersonianum]|uniref:RRM domain-containing protein n=1 Tax=Rhododendron griersonianum TaxID=479676 RepID=A0AAV6IZY6_9ERIC|nr:hypothetical protein RHGRI_027065 [Rhododendron griersonianum]